MDIIPYLLLPLAPFVLAGLLIILISVWQDSRDQYHDDD